MSLKEWMRAHFTPEEIAQIAREGGEGWPGLTTTADVEALYGAYRDEMWDVLASWAEDGNVLAVLPPASSHSEFVYRLVVAAVEVAAAMMVDDESEDGSSHPPEK